MNPNAADKVVNALEAMLSDFVQGNPSQASADLATEALMESERPYVVSEDVETIGTAIGELECPMCSYSHPMQRDALAALDRLALKDSSTPLSPSENLESDAKYVRLMLTVDGKQPCQYEQAFDCLDRLAAAAQKGVS